jgi:outer membrane protein assembly factor BamB
MRWDIKNSFIKPQFSWLFIFSLLDTFLSQSSTAEFLFLSGIKKYCTNFLVCKIFCRMGRIMISFCSRLLQFLDWLSTFRKTNSVKKKLAIILSATMLCFFMIFYSACSKPNGSLSRRDSSQVKPPKQIDSAMTIYLAGGYTDSVMAVDAQTGHVKWEAAINSWAGYSPIYSKGRIIVSGTRSDHLVYAFDTTGHLQWTFLMDNSASCAPIAGGGRVFISDAGSVYALDAENGSLLWHFTGGGTNQLAIRNNTVYFGTGTLIEALDAQTGTKKWEHQCIAGAQPPVVFDDRLYCLAGEDMLVLNTTTGTLITDSKGNYGIYEGAASYNVRYGSIYVLRNGMTTGVWVIDSIDPSIYKFSVWYNAVYDPPSTAPILEDSMAILPFGINNAMTGELLQPDFLSGSGTVSVTYLDSVLYCLTLQTDTNGYIHADLYAWDLRQKTKLWQTWFQEGDFINIEACVVTKSGRVYRGDLSF